MCYSSGMAENKINKKIEFAYSTQSITAELLLELEKTIFVSKNFDNR